MKWEQKKVSSTRNKVEQFYTMDKNNGLDAWRRLCKRYDPNNPQSQDALLKKVMRPVQATLDTLTKSVEAWESDYRLYVERTREQLSEAATSVAGP